MCVTSQGMIMGKEKKKKCKRPFSVSVCTHTHSRTYTMGNRIPG